MLLLRSPLLGTGDSTCPDAAGVSAAAGSTTVAFSSAVDVGGYSLTTFSGTQFLAGVASYLSTVAPTNLRIVSLLPAPTSAANGATPLDETTATPFVSIVFAGTVAASSATSLRSFLSTKFAGSLGVAALKAAGLTAVTEIDLVAAPTLSVPQSPPPPPTPSPGPLAPNAYITGSTTLSGYSLSTFTTPAQSAFLCGLATTLAVPCTSDWVSITGVQSTSAGRRRSRALLQSAVLVGFNVSGYSQTLTNEVNALALASTSGAFLTNINAALVAASLPAATGVSSVPASSVKSYVNGNVVYVSSSSYNGCLGQSSSAGCKGSIAGLVIGIAALVLCLLACLYFAVLKRKNVETGQKSAISAWPRVRATMRDSDAHTLLSDGQN